MYDRILRKIQDRIRELDYVITRHAHREMFEDDLTIIDVEWAILTGNICEKQRNKKTGEAKFRLRGSTLECDVEVILAFGAIGRLTIITVYTIGE